MAFSGLMRIAWTLRWPFYDTLSLLLIILSASMGPKKNSRGLALDLMSVQRSWRKLPR